MRISIDKSFSSTYQLTSAENSVAVELESGNLDIDKSTPGELLLTLMALHLNMAAAVRLDKMLYGTLHYAF